MGFIAIYCPRTGREVSTGVECDREAFQRLRPLVMRMRCQACGSEHAWSKANARLVELPGSMPAPPAPKPPPAKPVRPRPPAEEKPAAPAQPAAVKRNRTFSIAGRFLDRR
jgi:hypothetical protein